MTKTNKKEEYTAMAKTIEIRWHGRGGQGAKTAALLLADVAFQTGKFVQGFPEYGPERMGAPITAYDRISDKEIRTHSNIYDPDFVVVVDETLLKDVDVSAGIKEDGLILVNSSKSPKEVAPMIRNYNGKVRTLDAGRISLETLGRNIPNMPLLAGVVKLADIMDEELFIKEMRASFEHKFASKPEVIEGNMKALEMALKEVR